MEMVSGKAVNFYASNEFPILNIIADVLRRTTIILVFLGLLYYCPQQLIFLKSFTDHYLQLYPLRLIKVIWTISVILIFSIVRRDVDTSLLLRHEKMVLVVAITYLLATTLLSLILLPWSELTLPVLVFLLVRFVFDKIPKTIYTPIEVVCMSVLTPIVSFFTLYLSLVFSVLLLYIWQ